MAHAAAKEAIMMVLAYRCDCGWHDWEPRLVPAVERMADGSVYRFTECCCPRCGEGVEETNLDPGEYDHDEA